MHIRWTAKESKHPIGREDCPDALHEHEAPLSTDHGSDGQDRRADEIRNQVLVHVGLDATQLRQDIADQNYHGRRYLHGIKHGVGVQLPASRWMVAEGDMASWSFFSVDLP
jgi:hypothetical protein